MELQFPTFSIFLITFPLFLFMILKIWKKPKTLNLPPGPPKLPLIGNLHQLVGALPHQLFRHFAKQYGPLMHLKLGQVSTVVVSSPEIAKEVMKTHDVIFASRPRILVAEILAYNFTGIVFTPYGDYWRQLRKICVLELLNSKRVQSFRSIREEEVSNLINWIASKAGSPVNLTDKVHSLIYSIISRAAIGNKFKEQELFISLINQTTKVAAGFNIADLFPSMEFIQSMTGVKAQIEKLHRQTDRIVERVIRDHIKGLETSKIGQSEEEAEDLIDVLLKVRERGGLEFPLTKENIKAVIMDLLSAGGETTATTIDWAMSEMIKNTRVIKKAQAEVREVFSRKGKIDETSIGEMKFLKLVIKETLRLHPPGPLLVPRESQEKCVVNGFDIPSKTRVIVNAWAIGRDPEYWSEPEIFNPERFLDSSVDFKGTNFEFIPFGSGRRVCPGMSFAQANIELALAMLLYHFDWKLPNEMKNEDLDMNEGYGLAVRRSDHLNIIPVPYHPSPVS